MTGARIAKSTNDSILQMIGGSDWNQGASISLSGMNTYISSLVPAYGEFFIDAQSGTALTRLRGTPNGSLTWNNKNIVRSVNGITADADGNIDLLPIGSYIQFAGTQAPSGFLVCNGGAVSRTTYSKLFAVIGTKYGSGDGSTTFNLPNLTDRFLQGSTSAGTVKNAGLPNISGEGVARVKETPVDSGVALGFDNTIGAFYPTFPDYPVSPVLKEYGYYVGPAGIAFSAHRSNSIYGNSNTVQPPALTCLTCIKY